MTAISVPLMKGIKPLWMLFIGAAVLLLAQSSEAGQSGQEINFFFLTIHLLGGLTIFLYGMEMMSNALKMVAGDRMKTILAKLTSNRIMGLLTGTFVTSIIQSSSVTTVMLVGFVSAGLMSLTQAMGVILGADIGTTVTTQIVAFKVTKYAALFITTGFLMMFVGKSENMRQYGNLVMGLGMIFFGMGEMSQAMSPLRDYAPFLEVMQNVSNPAIGILVAAAFTGLIQSSSATMGVVVVLAMQGLITLEGGIALALGANIGTCVTAGLATIGKPREAVRVAVAHVTFKIAGVLLLVGFIEPFAAFVRDISPIAEADVTGTQAILAAEVPRQVANAHTLFNIGLALVFLPFTDLFVRFCVWVVPDKRDVAEALPGSVGFRPKYLDDTLLTTPTFALSMVRREIHDVAHMLEKMLHEVLDAVVAGDMEKMKALSHQDDQIDALYHHITRYLSKIGSHDLPAKAASDVISATSVIIELEHIGDVIENNFHHLANVRNKEGVELDQEEIRELEIYHQAVVFAFQSAVSAFIADDRLAAQRVFNLKGKIASMDTRIHTRQLLNMREASNETQLASFTLNTDIRENLRRIFYYAKRIAKVEAQVDHTNIWNLPELKGVQYPIASLVPLKTGA
ncbi:MAG: Na/Pi cotransporter family protein [Magnetococcales bacterium]|nr:Na/Pi cotransporter family protein [Magnetococcales bacterium]